MDAAFQLPVSTLADGAVIITANNRLARAVSRAFNRQQRAAGHGVWLAPAILPWQAWLDSLWSLSADAGGAAGRLALLSDFQARAVWRDIVRSGPQLPADTLAVARAAADAWRLCQSWQIAVGDLAASADSEDSRLFASWASEFHHRCRDLGCLDPGMLPASLTTDIRDGAVKVPERLHFVGFEDWTPAQREFLRILVAAGCTVYEEPPPRTAGPGACRVACHDERQELGLAARWARHRFEKNAAALIGVVIPDLASRLPAVRRAFLDVFSPDWRLAPPAELPVNFSYGESLARYGIVHAALLALKVLSGSLDYREAGQLLRTPYLPGNSQEAAARAQLDHDLREQTGSQVDLQRFLAKSEKSAPLFAGRLAPLLATSRTWPGHQGAAGWADSFREALRASGWPGDRALGSDDYQAGRAFEEQLETLRRCDSVAGPIDLPEALGLLQSLTSENIFQPAGHPDAIQVLGTLEALGQQFDALWICGLTSGAWPPATSPNPLLPLSLQRRLRMPDSSPPIARERAERRLRWLQASASDVVISWPEFSGDEPLAPSPLIAHLPIRMPADLQIWAPALQLESLAMSNVTEELIDDPAPPVNMEAPLRGGASLLERQARCPARAFLEFRLGAREMRAPAAGIDPSLRGTITHAVLRELYRRIGGHEQLCRLEAVEQTGILTEIIAAEIRHALPPNNAVIRRLAQEEQQRILGIMQRFLERERNRPPFSVLATEETLASRSGPPSIARLGIGLQPDRVDVLPDGRRLVIDYKTGRELPAARDLWGPRPRSPQLPLYATLADADGIAFVQIAAGAITWLGVGSGSWDIEGVVAAAELTKGEAQDWGALRASWWVALERLGAEILEGDFRVDRWRRQDAEGQWAMATRVFELPDEEGPGA